MTVNPSRFAGIFVTVLVAVALFLYFGGGEGDGTVTEAPRAAAGGQIVGSLRAEPRSFNRLVERGESTDTLSVLMDGRLVRVNRATFELEPWLAERWESSADGLTHTLHLREGLTWSDGAPFSSADVLFTFQAALDPTSQSVVAGNLTIAGEPIRAEAPDANTVVLTYPAPSGPGLRLLDALPILPKHKLESALAAGELASAWGPATPPSEIVGMGPFLLREYAPGQRVVLDRNPHYWRRGPEGEPLPYLDRIVLEIVLDQDTELLRVTSGAADLPKSELRPEDYVPVRRAEQNGVVTLVELGVSPDADAFWFCLKPEAKRGDPRFVFLQKPEFRQAISHAVDREAFAETVFLGEAVPIWGPITPGNELWFSPNVPRYPHSVERARELLASIGLEDRNGNGIVEDAAGTEARFTVLTQRGVTYYERGTTVLREQAAMAGIALDIVPLEQGTLVKNHLLTCNYDAIYMRPIATDLDPAGNLDYWLTSGGAHLWNMNQDVPATEWEAEIDRLMQEQARTPDPERRRMVFEDVQRTFAEHLPALYFAAPRLFIAHSTRLQGVVPAVQRPQVLWNADLLSVADAGAPEGTSDRSP